MLTPLVFFLSDPKRGQFDDEHQFTQTEDNVASNGVFNSIAQVWQVVKNSRTLASTMIGAVFMHIPVGGAQHVMNWLTRERGFELTEILTIYGMAFLIFGVIGTLMGGVVSDWYIKRFKGGRLRFFGDLYGCYYDFDD